MTPRDSYDLDKREKAVRLYLSDDEPSLRDVGKELGVSGERVRQYLDELGVRRRRSGRRAGR